MTDITVVEIKSGKPIPELPSGPTAIYLDDGDSNGPAAFDAETLLDRVDSVILVADGMPLGPARVIETPRGKMAGSPLQAHAIMTEQGRALFVTTPPETAALWCDVIERAGRTAVSLQFLPGREGPLN